jgi:hypothetical protein
VLVLTWRSQLVDGAEVAVDSTFSDAGIGSVSTTLRDTDGPVLLTVSW